MLEKQARITELINQYPEIEQIVSSKDAGTTERDKFEYYIASIITLAESVPNLTNSSQIKRIEKLQSVPAMYRSNMHPILAIAKGLLDTLNVLFKQ